MLTGCALPLRACAWTEQEQPMERLGQHFDEVANMQPEMGGANIPFSTEAESQGAAIPPIAKPSNAADWYFEGATPHGPMGLWLRPDTQDPGSIKGAELVLLLSQAEPLIVAVEEWLQSPWDPCPAADHSISVTACEAVVRDPALAPPGTRLALPLDFVLAPPPHTLQPPRLSWPCQVAEVVLALVDPEALDQLEPGGLLWLPASFGRHWPVSLRDPHGKLPPCQALFDMAGQQLVLGQDSDNSTAQYPSDIPQLHVVLTRTLQVPLNHWLGWNTKAPTYQWPMPQPWGAELRLDGQVKARGSLLQLGQGCGLWVERLDTPCAA